MRVGAQALLYMLVGDVQRVLFKYRWIVDLYPYLVFDVSLVYLRESLAPLLFFLLLRGRHNLV